MVEITKMIKIQSITLRRLEGKHHECVSKTVTSFSYANIIIMQWSHTAPDYNNGYHKVSFIVTFQDGIEYEGRLDMQKQGNESLEKHIQEHLEEIQEAINTGRDERPITIGFHTITCATEMLEMYLHLKNLISIGKKINHSWFKRPTEKQKIEPLIERNLPVSFPDKEDVYELMYKLEERRNVLIYGKAKKGDIETMLVSFQRLKSIMEEKIKEMGESIE